MNAIAPPKSYWVKSLPVRNEFKATLFLQCLINFPLKSIGILVASVNGKNCPQLQASQASMHNYQEDRVWRHGNNPSANLLKDSAVVTAACEFTITENSRISVSFLRADVGDGVGSVIFINCDLLMWYICCFFIKHSGRPVTPFLKTSAQGEG